MKASVWAGAAFIVLTGIAAGSSCSSEEPGLAGLPVDAGARADVDGGPTCRGACDWAEISAGHEEGAYGALRALVDAANGKLLVVATMRPTDASDSYKPTLIRCNLDGTACTYTDVSAGHGGYFPSAVIDSVSNKLLVVATDERNSSKPELFRCDLDGTSCTYTDISAGQGENSGPPAVVIDTTNRKLLVVTTHGSGITRPALFRCNLDGTSCTYVDIAEATGPNDTWHIDPSAVIDTVNGKLLVVTTHRPFLASFPVLFRCNLDGTACTYTDISAGHVSGGTALVDTVNSKLLVVTPEPGLIRCNLDGTACTYTAGRGDVGGDYLSATIDSTGGRLLVVRDDGASVVSCKLDGSSCKQIDVSACSGGGGVGAAIALDPSSHKLMVVVAPQSGSESIRPLLLVTACP